MNTKRHTRGAALIVALAILVVLLALAITFLTTSRLELQVATNVEEQLRTELLANGGLAIAIAFLQHDLIMHPTYTSLDHAWKTYFNGAWAAGKPWMFPDNRRLWDITGPDLTGDGNPDRIGSGVPIVSLTGLALNFPTADDGRPLYDTELSNDWLYMPIATTSPAGLFPPVERNFSGVMQFDRSINRFYVISDQVAENPALLGPDIPPFVDPITNTPRPRLASELVDIWADVDNTGDGVKDAIWIPVPQDIDFSNDGIDNDLNGVIDNPGEIARFLYWDPELERIMLTAPMVAGGNPVVVIPDVRAAGAVDVARLQLRYGIPDERMQELFDDNARWAVNSSYGHPSVDRRDNDHDFIEGNARTIDLSNELLEGTFLGRAIFPEDGGIQDAFDFAELRDLFPIHPRYTPGPNPLPPGADGQPLPFIYSSGEPITEIVGRLAITITDTASRVDIGAVGGFARDTTLRGETPYDRVRAINQGVTPFEYEPRVLPAFGPQRTEKLWNLTVGAAYGLTNAFFPANQPLYPSEYEFDVRHPGYGLTDDNANAFALAMDGVDNDGTGLIDPVFNLGSAADSLEVRRRYFEAFGQPLALEGIDDFSEYQRYRPLRNRIAESDNRDNNPPIEFTFSDGEIIGWGTDPNRPSIIDEVGELGDLVLRSKEQIKQIVENEGFVSGQRLYDIVRNHTTVHATQRTERRRFSNAFGQTQDPDGRPVRERGDITGTRLDLNYASVQQIFDAITEDFGFPSLYEEFIASLNNPGAPRRENYPDTEAGSRAFRTDSLQYMQGPNGANVPLFALGLGVESLDFSNTRIDRPIEASIFGITNAWAADGRLRAAQLAVNIADFRDRDHNRTSFTFTVPDLWWELEQLRAGSQPIQTREIEYTVSGIESIRINEIMARPTRRVEAEMLYGVADPDLDIRRDINVNMPSPANTYFPTSPWYLRPNIPEGASEVQIDDIRVLGNFNTPGSAVDTAMPVPAGMEPAAFIARNFDPNYFSIFLDRPGANGDPIQDYPDFRMTQRFFAWWTGQPVHIDAVSGDASNFFNGALRDPAELYDPSAGVITGLLNSGLANGGWERVWNKTRVIGDDTALRTNRPEFAASFTGGAVAPNFAEFEFLPSPGLPPGRYYLKVNTRGTVDAGDKLHFLIKYDVPGRGFIADYSDYIVENFPGPGFNPQSYFNAMRDNAQTAIAARDLVLDTGDPIVRPAQLGIPDDGTVFLPFRQDHFNSVAAGQLIELNDETGLPIPNNLDPLGSHAVTIPAYTDGLALHIAVWKGDGFEAEEAEDGELRTFAINYFEFSQEPAHEWVEIVNIAEDANPIDLSGWVLEVGHPEDEGDPDLVFDGEDAPFLSLRRRFRVPDGTQIVPGGKLLLGFSKFDFLGANAAGFDQNLYDEMPGINRNGMSLANTGFLPEPGALDAGFVPGLTPLIGPLGLRMPESSVPPIPMGDPRFANDLWPMGPPLAAIHDNIGAPGSVFRRVLFDGNDIVPGTLRDFVDMTGDGVDDLLSGGLEFIANIDPAVRPEELGASYNIASTPFDVLPFVDEVGNTTGSGTNKPYDRIVQLEPIDGTDGLMPIFGPAADAEAVARVVLMGGVFPNYPERDGRDNDLSSRVVQNDGIDNRLRGATLSANNGVDQGAPGFMPPLMIPELPAPQPGAYSSAPVPYRGIFPSGTEFLGDEINGTLSQILVGDGRLDTPEFKFFLERRWNPGDRVKVTLYTGRPSEERIADRITYTERDIVNRSIHDGIATPYRRFDPNTNQLVPQSLDIRYPTMWPDDTMGVDFYRSLERKHPMHTGDRFGKGHRWIATDGNYDDWDAGWGKKHANIRVNPDTGFYEDAAGVRQNSPLTSTWGPAAPGLDLRWSGFAGVNPRQDFLIGHQLEASPLRKNMAARLFENPVAPPGVHEMASQRQFRYAEGPSGSGSMLTRDPYALRPINAGGFPTNYLKRWTWHKPRVRNAALSSPGDLMGMPSVNFRRSLISGSPLSGIARTEGGILTIGNQGTEPHGTYRETVTSVVLGERHKNDITALTGVSLMEPKVLTAGQANVYLLTPGGLGAGEMPTLDRFNVPRAADTGFEIDPVTGETIQWPSGTVLTTQGSFPQAWTPVLLYSLPGAIAGPTPGPGTNPERYFLAPTAAGPSEALLPPDGANVLMHTARSASDVNFFFRNQFEGTGFVMEHLARRSTPRTRVAFWASANLPNVDRHQLDLGGDFTSAPAEVLFEWDGDTGLENGSYEVYIITAEPLDGLADYANAVLDPRFLPPLPLSDADIENVWRPRQRRLAETLTPTALAVLQQAQTTVPSSLPVDVEFLTDRDGNRRVWPGLYPVPADFRAGGGVDGEAINPESAGLLRRVTPDSQGVIHYGQVRVENNYLALRLRNWAAPGRLNRFSRVVLTPVNRVRGRININTVATVRDSNDLGNAPGPQTGAAAGLPYPTVEEVAGLPLFNPLQGLPGVLTASYDDLPAFGDATTPLDRLRSNEPGLSPRDSTMTYPNLLGLPIDGQVPVVNMYDRSLGLSNRIMQHRPDWGDGRYYRYPSDLVAWRQSVAWPNADHFPNESETNLALMRALPYGNDYPHYASEVVSTLPPMGETAFDLDDFGGRLDPALNDATLYLIDPVRGVHEYKILGTGVFSSQQQQYALNNARFEEGRYRFSRMSNLVTTRSDVFEIFVTAQSGYVPAAGERGGAMNYRNEFVVQGEQKIRVIYER